MRSAQVMPKPPPASPPPAPTGGTPSLRELFEQLETPLLHYAYRLTRNSETAQDIVQQAFLKLHPRLATIDQPKPWLYRTAHNLALNHLRKNRKLLSFPTIASASTANDSPSAPPLLDPADDAPLPAETIEKLEAIGHLQTTLKSLPERTREVLHLKFHGNHSYQEISDITGISLGNVGYILHHSLKKLAVELRSTAPDLFPTPNGQPPATGGASHD